MNPIQHYLESNGFKLIDRGSYWHANAAFRDGDNPTAIQIYKDSGCWKDFVQGDGIFRPFAALQQEVGDISDIGIEAKRTHSASDLIIMPKTYQLSILSKLMPAHGFYHNKKISSSTLKPLRSGFAHNGKLHSRYVFPILAEDGDFVIGFSGRYVGKLNDKIPKWKHIGRKTDWIFPAINGSIYEKAIESHKHVILVESIGDFLALSESGVNNVLVTFGISVSDKMVSYLTRYPNLKISICFNNDSTEKCPGLFGAVKSWVKLSKVFGANNVKIVLPFEKDFGDCLEKHGKESVKNFFCSEKDHDIQTFQKCEQVAKKIGDNNFQKIKKEYDKLKRKQD